MRAASVPSSLLHCKLGACGVYLFTTAVNLAFATLCYAARRQEPNLALYGVCVASVVWLAVGLWSWYELTGRFFDAYSLPATVLWLFNGGGVAFAQLLRPDAEAVFGEMQNPFFRSFTRADAVGAFYLTLFCLSALHAAALLAATRWLNAQTVHTGRQTVAAVDDPRLRWLGWALVAVSIVPAVATLRVCIARVQEGGYMALYVPDASELEGNTWYFILTSGLVPGVFYVMGSDLDNRRLRWWGWTTIVTFSTALLTLGTRALFYQNLVALLWLQHYGVRPIRKATWVVLLVAGMLISTLVFWTRVHSGQAAMTLESTREAVAEIDYDPMQPLNEMGGSLATVMYVIDLVPEQRGFAWGASYYHSLLSIFPGFIRSAILGDAPVEEDWLVEQVSPSTADSGGGIGFSPVAEAYLNFGVGAPLVFALAGIGLGAFAGWSHAEGRSGRLAFAACVISIITFSARASSLSFVRRILVLCVVPYIVLAMDRFLDSRSRRGSPGKDPSEGCSA